MKKLVIGLQGGSGFLGSVLANLLIQRGHSVRISTRKENNSRNLWVLPNTEIREVDMNRQEQLNRFFDGCDCVVNLIGILNEKKDTGHGFTYVHVELVNRLIKACKTNGIEHLVQVSSLGADRYADSYYLSSKGEAEKLLRSEKSPKLSASIVRPSVIFGPKDDFTNRFASILKLTHGLIPLACSISRLQPVYVVDVANAIITLLENQGYSGKSYDIGGPEIFTLREVVEYVGKIMGISTKVIPLNNFFSTAQAHILEHVPGKPFSRDNLRSLKKDSICNSTNTLEELGICATPMNEILPSYLANASIKNRYPEYRNLAGRP